MFYCFFNHHFKGGELLRGGINFLSPCSKNDMKKHILFYSLTALIACAPSAIYANLSVEVASGVVYNLPTPLDIQQTGYPDLNTTAHYNTHPFTSPYYYDLRLGYWSGNTAWEFEDIHHKVYMYNMPPEITKFSITHGYNLFTINHAWLIHNYIWRCGAGVVIAHPESIIRGQTFSESGGTFNDSGYYLAGPTVMGSIGRRFYISKHIFTELEGKLTASYAWVKVANGNAQAPNVALHADFGIGYDFG